MHLARGWLGGVLGVLLQVPAIWAHSALLPPVHSDVDYLLCLTGSSETSPQSLRYERYFSAMNDVLPLAEAADEPFPQRRAGSSTPFFGQQELVRWAWQSQRWTLEKAEGTVTFLTGNRDAAQLWLDSKADATDPQRTYQPSAAGRENYLGWWGVRYTFPLLGSQVRGTCTVGGRSLESSRFREGGLTGTYAQDSLRGEVALLSSRGIGLAPASGKGWALDWAATVEWGSGWRGLVAVEGLAGTLHWKRLRQLEGHFDTTAFAQDPEGFIRNLPVLSGQEKHRPLRRSVDRQFLLGLSREQSPWSWAVMYAQRVGRPNGHLGLVRRMGDDQRLLLSLQMPVRAVSLGYTTPHFSLFLSLSHLNPTRATTLGAQASLALSW
jgi:hypothetical protein